MGGHMALRYSLERNILSGCRRLPVCSVPSSSIGLSIINASEDSIDLCDIVNGNFFQYITKFY